MPHYKATVAFKAKNADYSDVLHITIEANNAIQAKVTLQDKYGEGSVKSVTRQNGYDQPIKNNPNSVRREVF